MAQIAPIAAAIGHVDTEDGDCRRKVIFIEHALELITDKLEALHHNDDSQSLVQLIACVENIY